MDAKSLHALPKATLRFIEPMYALSVQKLPEGKEWLYEVKFDATGVSPAKIREK